MSHCKKHFVISLTNWCWSFLFHFLFILQSYRLLLLMILTRQISWRILRYFRKRYLNLKFVSESKSSSLPLVFFLLLPRWGLVKILDSFLCKWSLRKFFSPCFNSSRDGATYLELRSYNTVTFDAAVLTALIWFSPFVTTHANLESLNVCNRNLHNSQRSL